MRIGAIFIMTLLFIGFLIPIGFSNESDLVVVTYGETTQENLDCKHMVNEYFKNNAHVNVENSNNKILTAKNINDLFGSFSDKFYPKDEIYLSSLSKKLTYFPLTYFKPSFRAEETPSFIFLCITTMFEGYFSAY